MNIEKGKLITLADNKEYCVVDKFVDSSNRYVFLIDINNNANILFGKVVRDRIIELSDPNELDLVIKTFYNNLYNDC